MNAENEEKVRVHWRNLEPFVAGLYLNSAGEDEHEVLDRIRKTFGDNDKRLVKIKTKYDPSNLFRLNSNIKPG